MEWFSNDLSMNSRLLVIDYNVLRDLAPIFLPIFISLPFVPSKAL